MKNITNLFLALTVIAIMGSCAARRGGRPGLPPGPPRPYQTMPNR